METQRYFNTLGGVLLKIVDAIFEDIELCKLLKYSDNRNPANCPNFEVTELLGKQVNIVPILPEIENQDGAFVTIFLSQFQVNNFNNDFQINSIRFDILVPNEDWLNTNETLKPFAIMARIDEIFNGKRVSGFGKLTKQSGEMITLSKELSGYSMLYTIDDYN